MTALDLGRYEHALAWLRARAQADPDVRAVWVGGSAATGGYDEWSDLDVDVLCAPGTSPRVHESLLASLPVEPASVWRLPEATWPDGRQSFVTLDADPGRLAAPTWILDLHVHDDIPAARRVDPRRHGRVLVVHDPEGVVSQEPEDEADLVRRRVAELDQVHQRRPVAGWLVARALARDHPAEATALHLRFGVAALLTLLRNECCPWRHDFGLRYLRADLPAGLADRVEALLPGPRPLAEVAAECLAWQDDLLAAPPLRGSALADSAVVGVAVPGGVPADALWAALTTPAGLDAWFGRSAHRVEGRVPGESLAITWAWPDEPVSRVRFTLHGEVLLIEHTGLIRAGDPASYAARWQRHLDLLAAHLAGAAHPREALRNGFEGLRDRYTRLDGQEASQ